MTRMGRRFFEYRGMKIPRSEILAIAEAFRETWPQLTSNQAITLAEHAIKLAIDKALGYMASYEYHVKEVKILVDSWDNI